MKHTIYQMLPRLWGDGTLGSIDNKSIIYLRDSLHIQYLWLTGIPRHESATEYTKGCPGSPYAIVDWYNINPYLAGPGQDAMQEFEALVERIHQCGLKLIIDFIPNHVARSYKGDLPHFDWCEGDWTDTLKLDWSRQEIISQMADILRFWASKGVDAFRCDMVELVPSDKLGQLIELCKKDYPDLLFIAEVYGLDNYRRYLDESHIDLLYDKSGIYDILRSACGQGRPAWELTRHWQWLGNIQGNMLNFLENHDEQRLASPFWPHPGGNYAWAALAFALLFNEASVMLYSGQEWGDTASEGASGRTSIFDWCSPAGVARAWRYAQGRSRSNAIFSRYRSLMALVADKCVSEGGNWDLCYLQDGVQGWNPERHFAFLRYNESKIIYVFCNFGSERAELELRLPEQFAPNTESAAIKMAAEAGDYCVSISLRNT